MGCTLPKEEKEERIRLLSQNLKKCSSHHLFLPNESDILPISDFNKDPKMFGGLAVRCRTCQSMIRCVNKDATVIRNRHKDLTEKQKLINEGYKYCPRCKNIKPITNFYRVRKKHPKKGRYHSYCIQCEIKHRSSPKYLVQIRQSNRCRRDASPKLKWAIYSLRSHQRRFAEVDITIDDILNIYKNHCEYCGCELIIGCNTSLDVKDPTSPVVKDNICVCCKPCNSAKGTKLWDKYTTLLHSLPELYKDIKESNERLYKIYYAQLLPLEELKRMASTYAD